MAGTYARILSRITLDSSQFTSEMRRVQRQAAAMTAKMNRLGTELTTAFTLPAGIGASIALNNFAQYDSLKKALETLEPTAAAVEKRLIALREIARQPGLTFEEAIKGDVRLRSVGIAASTSAKILKEFGNAIAQTGGGSDELNRVTVQLGQMAAKGKVFAQDLKPIIEAAPAVGAAIKSMFGSVDSETIQKSLAEQGKSSADFINELLVLLSRAPRVAGGFKNSVENLKDSFFVFSAKIGESINKVFGLEARLQSLGNWLDSAGDKFQALPLGLQKLILGSVGATAALGPLLLALGKLIPMFTSGGAISNGAKFIAQFANQLFRARALGGPLVLIFTALAANIKPVVSFISESFTSFQKLYKESAAFKLVIDSVGTVLKGVLSTVSFIAGAFIDVSKLVGGAFIGQIRLVRKTIEGIFTGNYNFKGTFKEIEDSLLGLRQRAILFWDAIRGKSLSDTGAANDKLKAAMGDLNSAMNGIGKTVKTLEEPFNKVLGASAEKKVDAVADAMKKYNDAVRTNGILASVMGEGYDIVAENLSAVESVIKELAAEGSKRAILLIGGLSQKMNELKNTLASNEISKSISDMVKSMAVSDSIFNGFGNTGTRVAEKIKTVEGAIDDLIKKGLSPGDARIQALKQTINDLKGSVDFVVNGMRVKVGDGIVEAWDKAGNSIKSFDERMAGSLDGMGKKLEDQQQKWRELNEEIGRLAKGNVFERLALSIAKSLGGAMKDLPPQVAGIVDAIGFGISTIGNISSTLFQGREQRLDNYYAKEKKAIEQSQLTEEVKAERIKKLEEEVDAKRRKMARDKAKADKAAAIFNATITGANAILSALATPLIGTILAPIVGGLVAAQIAAIASTPLPALAKGGLAYKPMTAIVGDNPNARYDPEVISPLSKLKKIIGGQKPQVVHVVSRIEGGHIYGVNKEYQNHAARLT